MQIARKNITTDPFVIYKLYEALSKKVERLGISDKPEAFCNCDESEFPVYPSKCKYIGPLDIKKLFRLFIEKTERIRQF